MKVYQVKIEGDYWQGERGISRYFKSHTKAKAFANQRIRKNLARLREDHEDPKLSWRSLSDAQSWLNIDIMLFDSYPLRGDLLVRVLNQDPDWFDGAKTTETWKPQTKWVLMPYTGMSGDGWY